MPSLSTTYEVAFNLGTMCVNQRDMKGQREAERGDRESHLRRLD